MTTSPRIITIMLSVYGQGLRTESRRHNAEDKVLELKGCA